MTDSVKYIDLRTVDRFLVNSKNLDYYIEFFKSGLNAVIKKWLNCGCLEPPEEIVNISKSEYTQK